MREAGDVVAESRGLQRTHARPGLLPSLPLRTPGIYPWGGSGASEDGERDLGPRIESDTECRIPDPAIHVELNRAEPEETSTVRFVSDRPQEERRQARDVDLPAVRVSREAEHRLVQLPQLLGSARTVREDEPGAPGSSGECLTRSRLAAEEVVDSDHREGRPAQAERGVAVS